uniref:Uncharacterized protein n=1 Tax=Lactuca sativa TaxID=4236 RepID=A0A9R1UMM8_LACSA|nr:hypothetical protein LSAT_V11C800393810 [Lactuca sativa]
MDSDNDLHPLTVITDPATPDRRSLIGASDSSSSCLPPPIIASCHNKSPSTTVPSPPTKLRSKAPPTLRFLDSPPLVTPSPPDDNSSLNVGRYCLQTTCHRRLISESSTIAITDVIFLNRR